MLTEEQKKAIWKEYEELQQLANELQRKIPRSNPFDMDKGSNEYKEWVDAQGKAESKKAELHYK